MYLMLNLFKACRCQHASLAPKHVSPMPTMLLPHSDGHAVVTCSQMFLVLAAGIEWLLDKFKAYVILRDRLLSDTSILRDKLEVAAPEVQNGQSNSNGSAGMC